MRGYDRDLIRVARIVQALPQQKRRHLLALAAQVLTAVWVPDPQHEAMRELTRAREVAVKDRHHEQPVEKSTDDNDDAGLGAGARRGDLTMHRMFVALEKLNAALMRFVGIAFLTIFWAVYHLGRQGRIR
jgi:hypothetical protein